MSPRIVAIIIAAMLTVGSIGCGGHRRKEPAKTSAASATPAAMTTAEGLRCLFDSKDLAAIGVKIGGAATVTVDGALLAEADGRIYDTRTWKPMVGAALEAPLSVAADRQGALYVVSGARFGVINAGAFAPITSLPSVGFGVSVAAKGNICLYGDSSAGGGLVFLLRRTAEGKSVMRQLLTTAEPIDALEAVGDDVIFACGNRIYRAGLIDAERTAVVLLAALSREAVIHSLAVDSARGVIYLATDDTTFVFAGAAILPILDLGGRLLLSGAQHEQLIVYQPLEARAFDVNLPQLSRALAAPQKERPAQGK